ncbi:putative rossmann-like alpha/beta/alpha sandwich protein [Helianthus debilis subsp. tardiflorus]
MRVKIVTRIVEGDAGKAICKEAEKVKPIAVVMGTRGRSLMQSVLQGSVSEYCFHNCKAAPVIIVPGIVLVAYGGCGAVVLVADGDCEVGVLVRTLLCPDQLFTFFICRLSVLYLLLF